MATYSELYDLRSFDTLRHKVTIACLVAVETIRAEPPATPNHTERAEWAKAVLDDPDGQGRKMYSAVLAANSSSSVAVIQGASDAVIQTAVDDAINLVAV